MVLAAQFARVTQLSSINGGDLKHVYGEHIQRQDLIPVSSENAHAILKE
jgi:hypothetical protein